MRKQRTWIDEVAIRRGSVASAMTLVKHPRASNVIVRTVHMANDTRTQQHTHQFAGVSALHNAQNARKTMRQRNMLRKHSDCLGINSLRRKIYCLVPACKQHLYFATFNQTTFVYIHALRRVSKHLPLAHLGICCERAPAKGRTHCRLACVFANISN